MEVFVKGTANQRIARVLVVAILVRRPLVTKTFLLQVLTLRKRTENRADIRVENCRTLEKTKEIRVDAAANR